MWMRGPGIKQKQLLVPVTVVCSAVELRVGCRLVTQSKTLQRISLCGNSRLTADDLRTLLISSSAVDTCPLTNVEFCGCGVVSPISSAVVDAVVRKLSHCTALTRLRLSCQRLSEADAASLRAVWCSRWQRQSSVVIGRETVTLSVNDETLQ